MLRATLFDEIGYLPIDRLGANLFFQLISRRYERGPMILTSNQSFAAWGDVFGDRVIATAILDRLLHHAVTLNIRGNSYRLKEKLKALPEGRYDYILIDCPPTLGVLTVNALNAVTEVLVPVECHVMGLHGLAQLWKTVELVKKRLNPDLNVTGIVACRVDRRTKHGKEVVEKVRAKFPEITFRTEVRENVRLAECPSQGGPITAYDTKSAGAEDYRKLADEVIAQESQEAREGLDYGKVANG